MMGLDRKQFEDYVLGPTMRELFVSFIRAEYATLETIRAEYAITLETIWHESDGLTYIAQVGGGPGLGLGQCEPPTFEWLTRDYLPSKQPALWSKFGGISPHWPSIPFEELAWNLRLAVALVRCRYLAAPGAIPITLEGRAAYWGQYYQTTNDPVKIQQYIDHAKGMK